MARQRSWRMHTWAGGSMDDELNQWLRETEEQVTKSAMRLRDILEKRFRESPGEATSETDPVEALQALKRMKDLGLIDDEEYQQKKADILGRL